MSTEAGRLLVEVWRAYRDRDPDGVYDEVLREVSDRAAADGSLGKADIGALVLWKRITAQATWARALLLLPDHEVRAATAEAYVLANDVTATIPAAGQAARDALAGLPGMGGTAALASAVLLALAPGRMAVWDRRVGEALTALRRRPESGSGFYGRYLNVLVGLAVDMNTAAPGHAFCCRDVDLALFAMAGSPALLDQARSTA